MSLQFSIKFWAHGENSNDFEKIKSEQFQWEHLENQKFYDDIFLENFLDEYTANFSNNPSLKEIVISGAANYKSDSATIAALSHTLTRLNERGNEVAHIFGYLSKKEGNRIVYTYLGNQV
ncbi:MAG: hypothetical protein AAF620_01340 [Bacteroidota bacterium]